MSDALPIVAIVLAALLGGRIGYLIGVVKVEEEREAGRRRATRAYYNGVEMGGRIANQHFPIGAFRILAPDDGACVDALVGPTYAGEPREP